MSWTIHKFPVPMRPFALELPENASPLCMRQQLDAMVMWVWLDPTAKKTTRRFEIFGTGHPTPPPSEASYVDTIQVDAFVWHLFEIGSGGTAKP